MSRQGRHHRLGDVTNYLPRRSTSRAATGARKKQHLNYPQYSGEFRNAVVAEYPRTPNFKDDIIQAFCDAIHKKPETTFGNVKADVLADKDPKSFVATSAASSASSGWLA